MDDLYRDAAADDGASSAFVFDNSVLERALKHIYEKDFHPMTDIEENLFHETMRVFTDATDKGVSRSDVELQPKFSQKLEQGNAVFSAFKVHRMQNDIAAQLYDSNGVLKPFEQWKRDVHPMLAHYPLNIFSEILFYKLSLYISYLQIFSFGLNTHEISRF